MTPPSTSTSGAGTTRCPTNLCLNAGTCIISSQTNNAYFCLCAPNFTGTTCQIALGTIAPQVTDQCTSGRCLNGGSCYTSYAQNSPSVYCVCNPNYTGLYCQITLNGVASTPLPATTIATVTGCASNPCLFGSTCVPITQPGVNPPYACVCQLSYTGPRCDQLLSTPRYIITDLDC